mgnify:CR=1 FL=1
MQMKEWLNDKGVEMDSLGKKQVSEMIKEELKQENRKERKEIE